MDDIRRYWILNNMIVIDGDKLIDLILILDDGLPRFACLSPSGSRQKKTSPLLTSCMGYGTLLTGLGVMGLCSQDWGYNVTHIPLTRSCCQNARIN